jgi:hypothetical protein
VDFDMSIDKNEHAFSEFFGVATRRLWLLKFIACLHTGLWIVATALLVLGGIHVGLKAVGSTVLLLVIAVVSAWVLLQTMVRRPTQSSAAVEVDRLFTAQALIVTAVECQQLAPEKRSSASRIVIEQANHSAQAWNDRLRETIRSDPRSAARIALIPLFAATLLLAQPGVNVEKDARIQSQTTANQSEGLDTNSEAESVDTVAQLRRELADEKTGQALAPAVGDDDVDADDQTQISDEMPPENARLGMAATDRQSGGDAGDGKSSSSTIESQAGTQIDKINKFGVLRTGQATAAATAGDRQYANAARSAEFSGVRPLPAAAPESGHDKSTLSAAEAAYAARYLRAIGENNE